MISLYYRNPDNVVIRSLKRGTVNALAYVQLGAKKVFQPVINGWVYIIELSKAKNENMLLKDELTNLKSRLNDLRVIQEENQRLRGLVQVPVKKQYKTVLAVPVGIGSNNWEASTIIDKGSSQGVKIRMPVINQDGLVGQVVDAAPYASQVQLITDTKSGAAAEIVGRNLKGLVQGTFDNKLEMTLIKKTATVKVGDAVITSGLGGVYPRGLFIGRVKSAKSPPAALYMDIIIKSEVDFNNLQEVLVIKSPLPPNIDRFK